MNIKSFNLLATGLIIAGYCSAQVGIGTTSPTVELDIESSTATTSIDINNTAADGDPQINFQLNNTTTFSIGIDDTDDFFKIGTTAPATSNRLTIDNTGLVGIGTEAPDYTLDVAGNFGLNEYIYHNDDVDTYIRLEADQIKLYAGSQWFINLVENGVSDRFVVNDNGNDVDFRVEGATDGNLIATDAANDNLGIGTNTPTAKLNVEGSVIFNDLGADVDVRMEGDTDANLFFLDASADYIGIGTNTPSYFFHVAGDVNVGGGAAGFGGTAEHIRFDAQSDIWYMGVQNEAAAGDSDFYLGLAAEDGMFHIENGGNVGIGTSTPSAKLEVAIDNATTSSVDDVVVINKGTTGAAAAGIGAGLVFHVDDAGGIEEQGRINVILEDVTDASEDASMTFSINQAGTISEIMRIDGTAGYVGIGTNAPDYELDVAGNVGVNEYIYHNDDTNTSLRFETDQIKFYAGGNIVMDLDNNGTTGLIFNQSGVDIDFKVESDNNANMLFVDAGADLVGIGMDPVTNTLEVNGTASKTDAGDWLANSDRRLKTNITPLDSAEILNALLNMRGVSYYWNDTLTSKAEFRSKELQYGFIAQEVKEVFPHLVELDNEGYYQMPYGTFDPYYIEAFKAMQAEIDLLKAELEKLKARELQ